MGVNSPLPARLQEETRKAAKIMRSFVDSHNNGLDKVVPQSILQKAVGFAIFTVFKAGFVFSARAGSGVVIARTPDGGWSAPSAIGLGGFGFGGQMGAEVTDFLIVLNSSAAVKSFMAAGSLTLGGNLSVAVGPLGRNAEGSGAVSSKGKVAAMYSYSKTKGLFGGVSVEGSIIVERQDANRLAYGGNPTAKQILSGTFDAPDWAQDLISSIERCTGLPGGQRWRNSDEEGEGGGMGYGGGPDSPAGERGRYVFGEGVGGHGSPTAKAEGKEGRRRGASVGMFDQGGSVRPGMSKRNSSFNPFSSGSSSPKRAAATAGMASSENYNAGLTWDSDGPMTAYGNRSRSGSSALRPAIDLEGRARSYSDPKARRPQRRKDEMSSDDDGLRGGDELTGTWGTAASDEKGLSSSFARLKTDSGIAARSRSNSKPPLMASLDEVEYTLYETESRFATQFGKNGSNGSPRRLQEEFDPFGGESSTSGRAFEAYQPPLSAHASPSRSAAYSSPSRRTGTPPRLDLKPGLSSGPSASEMGYARAIALFDLPAGQSGDLALKKGGVLFAMDKIGSGEWWRGMNTAGEAGIFPANYVEVVEIPRELKGGLSRMDLKKRVPDLEFE